MKEELTFEAVRDVFTNYLQQKKHRKTPERFAILKQIFDNEGHFDAESLYNQMQNDYRVSLATVYNTMELLLDCGLIVKHPFAGQTSQFEKTFGNSIHHHLVCTKCGSVKEFSDKKIRTVIQSKSFSGFESSHYSLYLYGLCKKCQLLIKQKQ